MRWFVVMLNDALAIYLISAVALKLAHRDKTSSPTFLDVQFLVSVVTSIFSGHVFALKIDSVHQIRLTTANRPGLLQALFGSAGLAILSFGACASADFFFVFISIMERSARRQFFSLMMARNNHSVAAALPPLPSSTTAFVNLGCFYLTELLKLGVLISYIQLAEQAQAAIRGFKDYMATIAEKGVVTAEELKSLSTKLGEIFKGIRLIDFCFSFLALVWYAELMLAIVSSVHIALSYVEDRRSFRQHLSQVPRNVYLLVMYLLVSHRLCSVQGESQAMPETLSRLASHVSTTSRVLCIATKVLRRACVSSSFVLSAWDVFEFDDHFYMNTLKSILMYGVILQQLTTTKSSP
ncbi:unnamed protein product [Ixodes pacificus]